MDLRVVSHINGDGDLLEAWFKYYRRLGVSSFHLILHGPREENERLYALKDSHPVVIEDAYEGPFHSEEKKNRINSVLKRMRDRWILVVDSDEFLEFPYSAVSDMVWMLRLVGRNALFAPMLQHLTSDGSLDTPEVIADPFRTFPLCSVDLYQRMGVRAAISKWPLFYCTSQTLLRDGRVYAIAVFGHDVTERKRMEEALRKSEERFATVFRRGPLAFMVTNARDNRYIEVNAAFEEITGYSREEVIGKTPYEIGL